MQLEAEPIHGGHRRFVGLGPGEEARVRDERVGVVAIHVLDDPGRPVGERVGPGPTIVGSVDPSHRGKASHEVDVGNLEPPEAEVVEVGPVPRGGVALEIGGADGGQIAVAGAGRLAHQRHAAGSERVARSAGLGHEQAGTRVAVEILRVDGHRRDQNERAALGVQRVGHDRGERMPGMLARDGGERPAARLVDERTRALGERRLGDGGGVGSARRSGVAVHGAITRLTTRSLRFTVRSLR